MDLGSNIRKHREEMGLSRSELAEKIGISYFTLYNYEFNNREPSIQILINIADIFQVSLDDLCGREYKPRGS